MALWQVCAIRDALRGNSVIDMVFVTSYKAPLGAFVTHVKRHNLQILH